MTKSSTDKVQNHFVRIVSKTVDELEIEEVFVQVMEAKRITIIWKKMKSQES